MVYRGREAETDRWVALKVIDAADSSPYALESFRREALALGALGDHPHIVTLYRTATLADHRPFLVLELCTTSIGRQIEQHGAISARRATAVAVKIAGALETAHRAGLLHLDVKPGNILITQYGEPALTDFGVARLHARSPGTATVVGLTAAHSAPEMLGGEVATPATDVYQLASTVYHMVTGRPAFRSFDGEAAASVAYRVLHEPVEPITSLDVPRELADLVVWAMAKDPGARPASAAAFADALRAVELACGWLPTVPAIPGGHLPPLTQSSRRIPGETPRVATTGRDAPGARRAPAPHGHLVTGPTPERQWAGGLQAHLPEAANDIAAPPPPPPPAPVPVPVPRQVPDLSGSLAPAPTPLATSMSTSMSPGARGSDHPVARAQGSDVTGEVRGELRGEVRGDVAGGAPDRASNVDGVPDRAPDAGDRGTGRRRPRRASGLEAIVPAEERTRRFGHKRHPEGKGT